MTYYASETDTIQKKIKLRARGNFRRTFCDFPPLRLNFNINDSADGVFGGIDKLKVVPHCRGGFEIYILKEYLIYKLYNALTDYSLRVRLMEISYFNTSRNSKPIKEYGFAIEPIELFEKRTGLMEYNSANLSQRNIKPDIMDLVAIFNYMIGNTDWSVPNQHNVQTFSQYESHYLSSGTLVPYDFDHAGLVNTFYAHPYKDLPIESVLDRYYLGMCRNDEDLIPSIKVFAGKKSEFYRIINEFPYLNAASKKEMINYLNSFFVKFDKRNTIVYEMLKSCQNL